MELEMSCSRHFLSWLYEQHLSLAFSTYQTHQLFLIGLKPNGELSGFKRFFDRAMGMYITPDHLYLSTRYQIWQFNNVLEKNQLHEGYDALYLPRIGYTTGELDVHDLVVAKDQVIFVNTLYSCLATLSNDYSFAPIWKPPFISKLAPEERCHLNGLAMADGKPVYVTAISRSDVAYGWRQRRHEGGTLIDVQSDTVLLSNLSMPHSPRFYQNKIWVLNSGTGDFGYFESKTGEFQAVTFCPGYLRGLTFAGKYAIVGLSKPRDRAFSGLALDDKLQSKDTDPRCGLMVINLETGDIAHWLELHGGITEIYDVQVLFGVRRPMALGFKTDEINRLITVEPNPQFTVSAPQFPSTSSSKPSTPMGGVIPTNTPSKRREKQQSKYEFKFIPHLDLETALKFDAFTFPKLSQNHQIKGQLMATTASLGQELVGMAIADIQANFAEVISLFVSENHRQRGIATQLVAGMEQGLTQGKIKLVQFGYRSNWQSVAIIERILQKQAWATPVIARIVCKSDARIAQAPWLHKYKLPPKFTIFPWSELTTSEKKKLQKASWYPKNLTPFQEENKLEYANSLGMRYGGEVVGWIVTHRTAPHTIQYTSLFVKQQFQPFGRAIFLLAESIKLQLANGTPNYVFMVDMDHQQMMRFVERRLKPFLTSIVEYRGCFKEL